MCLLLALVTRGPTGVLVGDGDDLRGVGQPRAEADLEGETATRDLTLAHHALHGERHRGRRGVAGVGDVAGHRDAVGELELLGHGVDDAHVGLVGDERVELVGGHPGSLEGALGDGGHAPDRPPEDGLPLHADVRPVELLLVDVDPALGLRDDLPLGTVGAPDGGTDAGGVGRLTTAAPAPSPKMNAVPRSSRLVKSESRSTPTTRTLRAVPPRTMSDATAMPWQ